jgi:hypothetical protein
MHVKCVNELKIHILLLKKQKNYGIMFTTVSKKKEEKNDKK